MLNGAKPVRSREAEDALMYLPRKGIVAYRRGQIIFSEDQPSDGIFLVVKGRVKVSVPINKVSHGIIDIFSADQFFGESGLLQLPRRGERAVALEPTTLMSWSTPEIEEQIQHQPKLGLALIQMMVERCIDFEERLQHFAGDKTAQRVMRSLLRFAERMGTKVEDGSLQIPPMTHRTISEFVGTSREIVTFQMNRLREEGLIRYSRKSINVYPEALWERLGPQGDSGRE